MFTDIYLRGTGKIAVDNALQAAGLIDDAGAVLRDDVAIDRIGTIRRVVGQGPLIGGIPSTISEPVDGYHVNLRLAFDPSDEIVEALYSVTVLPPDTPSRVWA